MINWLIVTSVTGGLAALFLILCKKILVRRLGGSGYYLVCAVALVLFVLPVRVAIPSDMAGSIYHKVRAVSDTGDKEQQIPAETFTADPAQTPEQDAAPSWVGRVLPLLSADRWITLVWASGFVFMMFRYLVSYFRFKYKVIGRSQVVGQAQHLNVVRSGQVHSPMLIGFFKPVIVIPDRQIHEEDYKLAILHEWNHYKQGDAWIKLLAVLVNSLHWFNPVTYFMTANLSEACEYACDEKITKHMKMHEKKKYSEMILAFASRSTPMLSSSLAMNKKQLYRRFELIMGSPAKNKKYFGALLVLIMLSVSIFTTSLVFAETPKPLAENAGALKTYYNSAKTLEQNIHSTLGIIEAAETVQVRVTDAPFLIDADGLKVDLFNRTEPYYMIRREWKPQSTDLEQKTLSIEGQTVTVAFAPQAVSYKDDPVIERMIRNQITFELGYQSKKKDYDHSAFIHELIQRGMLVIDEVTEAKDFPFEVWPPNNGDQLGKKPLTRFDKRDKTTGIFNQKVELNRNVDGGQGKQLGNSFILRNGETLVIDVKELTDKMPTVNWAIINVTTGEPVNQMFNAPGGYRYTYTPGRTSLNNTFKVVMSGEKSDLGDIEIFISDSIL